MLKEFAHYPVYSFFGMAQGSRLSDALEFFIYDVIKILLLLSVIIFIVSVIRSYFPPEKTKRILSHKREFIGNIIAALLGIVTPFCSCSAVPLFIGFVEAGVPLGVTFSFLISSPMVNEVAVVLPLPEMIILRKVIKAPLLVVFVAIMTVTIIGVGYLFNAII
jgi:uncharacterized membrane protein YraQ (UPF0718 family)